MPRKVPQPHGGSITLQEKGDKPFNPKGRPKQPKKLKEFIKNLETENDEIMFPFEALELVEKKGKKFYKLKGSKGSKMFLTAYNKALKGDVRWAEFLVKMGFAGGFEPTKTDNKTEISGSLITWQENKNYGSKPKTNSSS